MTVAELIEELKKMPQDAEVYFTDSDFGPVNVNDIIYKKFEYTSVPPWIPIENRLGVVID